jgi:hypothetical protein
VKLRNPGSAADLGEINMLVQKEMNCWAERSRPKVPSSDSQDIQVMAQHVLIPKSKNYI